MPDPVPYHPSFSFTGYQATNPELPLPGPRVDTEYQNIETALGETQSALADIRRNDGQLQNGIVTPDSLAPGMSLGVLPPTAWATGAHYYPPAGVWYGYKLYQCVVEHVATAFNEDYDNGYWNLVVDFQPPIDAANAAAANANADAAAADASASAAGEYAGNAQAAAAEATHQAQLADDARVAAEQAKADTIGQVANAQAAAAAAAAAQANAQGFANNASASATAAANSATAAAGSASAAGTQASNAAASASSANISAGNASASAGAAHTDAVNAAASAANAGTAADNASNSAIDAVNAKNQATGQATLANNSATAAANSATLAQNALGAMPGNFAGYTFLFNTFAAPPVSGQIRCNNGTLNAATASLYIHDTSADSTPFRPYAIANLTVGTKLYIVDEDEPGRYIIYQINANPILQTGYTEIPVAHVGNSGNAIGAQRCTITALAGSGGAADSDFYERFYNYSQTITEPPGAGEVRLNNIVGAATLMWIYAATADGVNIGALLAATIRIGGQITLRKAGALDVYVVYDVVGPPVLKAGGSYYEVAVRLAMSLGSLVAGPLEFIWRGGSKPTAERRNRAVNGAMQISQEFGSSLIGVGFPADMWNGTFIGGAHTQQRVAPGPTPKGNLYRLEWKVTTAKGSLAAGDIAGWFPGIEGEQIADLGWGAAGAKQIIIRFGFRGPAGTYALSVRNGASDRSYVTTFTVTAGQANTDVEFAFVIPGDTAGVWPKTNVLGLLVGIGLANGTTYQAPSLNTWVAGSFTGHASCSNGMAALNTFHIMDYAVYADPLAIGVEPPYEIPNSIDELQRCQRYFQQVSLYWCGQVVSTVIYYATVPLPVQPRVSSATLSGVNVSAASFPATPGSAGGFAMVGTNTVREGRTANATANGQLYATTITANARI